MGSRPSIRWKLGVTEAAPFQAVAVGIRIIQPAENGMAAAGSSRPPEQRARGCVTSGLVSARAHHLHEAAHLLHGDLAVVVFIDAVEHACMHSLHLLE